MATHEAPVIARQRPMTPPRPRPSVKLPPLSSGDRLTRAEFERRGIDYIRIDDDDHVEPGAQLASKDKIGDLACNPAVGRSHSNDHQMVS